MTLNEEQKSALKEVLGHFWEAENSSAQEYYNANGTTEGHVFEALVILDNLLYNRSATTEEYLETNEDVEDE